MTNSLPKSKDQFEYWLGALPFYNNVKAEGLASNFSKPSSLLPFYNNVKAEGIGL